MSMKDVIQKQFNLEFIFCSPPQLPLQASGYGSGDSTYEDMEGVGEVKKFVEKIVYTMVCIHTYTLCCMLSIPVSCPEMDQRKQLLSW